MRDASGNLLPEAIELLNKAGREAPHEMYPLSQLAADMGRAGLLAVKTTDGTDVTGLASRKPHQRPWLLHVTEKGWEHVTDPEALTLRRREMTMKRLRDAVPDWSGDSRIGPIFNRGNNTPI